MMAILSYYKHMLLASFFWHLFYWHILIYTALLRHHTMLSMLSHNRNIGLFLYFKAPNAVIPLLWLFILNCFSGFLPDHRFSRTITVYIVPDDGSITFDFFPFFNNSFSSLCSRFYNFIDRTFDCF